MNKFSKILALIATFFIWACFFNSVFGVQQYTLEVLPNIQHKIESAYPYKHLSEEEKARAYTVIERTYVILDAAAASKVVGKETGEPGSTNIAIIPNLNPCIGIIIYYGTRAAVFHQHFSSNINDLIAKTKTYLGINDATNPENIKIYIYAFRAHNFATVWQSRYQGKTQEAELAQIKRTLMQQFRITKDSQVEDCLWTPNSGDYENYGNYYGLDTSIVVSISGENKLTIYNTSLVHEEVFFKNQYSPQYILGDTILRHTMTKLIQSYIFDKYQTALLRSPKYGAFYNAINMYGVMPYMRALHFGQYFCFIDDASRLGRFLGEQIPFQCRDLKCTGYLPKVDFEVQPIPCYICGKVERIQKCSKCGEYCYCSKECQTSHWKNGDHKSECQILKIKM